MIQEKFNLDIKNVGADRGYDTTPIHHGLKTLEITGYISPIKYDNHLPQLLIGILPIIMKLIPIYVKIKKYFVLLI